MNLIKLKFLILFLITSFLASGQTEKEVIIKALQKIAAIKSCNYEQYYSSKLNGMRDTSYETGRVYFEYIPSDTLLGMRMSIENYKGITDIYNGADFIKVKRTDSAVYIWKASDFPNFKHSMLSDRLVFAPFFKGFKMLTDALNDSVTVVNFLKDTVIDNETAIVILSSTKEKLWNQDKTQTLVTMYFRKKDFLPVGYVQQTISAKNKNVIKFEKAILQSLHINKSADDKIFKIRAPYNYTLKQQTSQIVKNYIVIADAIRDLLIDTVLKSNSHPYLENKNLLLILINDTNSYPCIKTLDLIDSIYPLIKNKVLPLVISTTTINEKYGFVKEESNFFPEFFNASTLLKESKIYAYPTFFIINKQLKIVYKSEGFNMQLKPQLLNQIDQLN